MRENNSSARQTAKPPPAHPFHNIYIHNILEPAPAGTQRHRVGPAPWRGLIRPLFEPCQTLCRCKS
uniref:Uncharacterized protein n=1 Tax=uncultured Rhodospirillales bacterium HF4000_24M03 TaxID=710788 RepID=E0XW17_9PROT|nr:hypothetical protein [uncultured Rhodospirillales bacterium HF4000_24M03]